MRVCAHYTLNRHLSNSGTCCKATTIQTSITHKQKYKSVDTFGAGNLSRKIFVNTIVTFVAFFHGNHATNTIVPLRRLREPRFALFPFLDLLRIRERDLSFADG